MYHRSNHCGFRRRDCVVPICRPDLCTSCRRYQSFPGCDRDNPWSHRPRARCFRASNSTRVDFRCNIIGDMHNAFRDLWRSATTSMNHAIVFVLWGGSNRVYLSTGRLENCLGRTNFLTSLLKHKVKVNPATSTSTISTPKPSL